ncbi:MAG TPA: tRNA (guanine(46)-N(7))-methyltransferase TrmB [Rhizomicrobium sp.]
MNDRPNEHPERRRQKLYGRRKGPKLTAHQSGLREILLPALTLDLKRLADPLRAFAVPVDDVWLEVGFGAGEHLLWQAQNNPNVGLIGAEPYESGVAKLLSKISSLSPTGGEGQGERVSQQTPTLEDAPRPPHLNPLPRWGRGSNIRVHEGDAREIIAVLPDDSIGRVFLLFPDPWPKTRHHKRRFLQTDLLTDLARIMKAGAEFRFASDDTGYFEWALERLMAHPDFAWTAQSVTDWTARPAGWPPTRYEEKALHGPPAYLRFIRRDRMSAR